MTGAVQGGGASLPELWEFTGNWVLVGAQVRLLRGVSDPGHLGAGENPGQHFLLPRWKPQKSVIKKKKKKNRKGKGGVG